MSSLESHNPPDIYRGFFEHATCGIFRSTEDGRFLVVNPAMAKILAYDSPEDMLRGIENIDDEIFLGTGEYNRLYALAKGGEEPVRKEFQVFCGDGSLIWANITARFVEEDGAGLLEGYLTDVTEQKRGEWLLKEKDELYKGIYEYASEGLFQCTPSGRLVSGSPSMASSFGFESFEEMSREAPSFSDLLESPMLFSKMVHELEKNGIINGYEAKARKRGGEKIWVSINARVYKDVDGGPILFQGSLNEITGRKRAEGKLEYQAMHDSLTGLMNRGKFCAHLDNALVRVAGTNNYNFCVIFADLDRFRIINDSLGYEIGDKILISLAKRIESVLGDNDVLSRFGSDNFGIFLDGVESEEQAVLRAKELLAALDEAFVIEGHEVFVTMSLGIALSRDGCCGSGKLLADAEQAMSKAKRNPHSRHVFMDESMSNSALERLCIETDLRKGLERDEFKLFYQPIVDLRTGEPVGMEALMRWRHPVRNLVSPMEFIPVAEETGMIIPLGYKALRQACNQIREWNERYRFNPPKSVAVNLSVKQFLKTDLVEDVKCVLKETGLDGRLLKLEVTESTVMSNPEAVKKLLIKLMRLGVNISIDDFGSGYSSLSYLKDLPSDTLKIDRSFIGDIDDSASNRIIAGSIISLAASLGKKVVAEGIEKAEHWHILSALGCRYGQGFFFSQPADPERAADLLSKRFILPEPAINLSNIKSSRMMRGL